MSHVLWIRSEVFDHGVFNTSVRWTVPKVFDFLSSLREAIGSKQVPKEAWMEVTTSRTKPTLNEAEAAAYWQVVTVLQQSIMGDTKDVLDIRIIGLILACQVFSLNRVGKTDQFARSGEMWPGGNAASTAVTSPRHSPRAASPRGTSPRGVSAHYSASTQGTLSRGKDFAAAVIAFFRQHFGHFLQIICFSLATEPAAIRAEEFDVLGIILRAGVSFSMPVWRVSEAVAGLSGAASMNPMQLRGFVEKCLVWNEEVYSFEVASQAQVPSSKTINIVGMNKTTWFQRPATASIDYLHITGCTDCCIYVMGSIRFCLIAGCHDCTVVLGGVSTLCTIHNCEKISVHVAAHCFKMENSIDSSAYLYCHVAPILTGDTRGIKLAPYNVMYSQLDYVLEAASMRQEEDFSDVWAHPICSTLGSPDETLTGRNPGLEAEATNSTYHFVHPSQFIPLVVPELLPRPLDYHLVLPQVYNDALEQGKQEMRSMHEQLAEIKDDTRRRKAHQAIQGHFREWLQTTGKSRQLADLVKLTAQMDK